MINLKNCRVIIREQKKNSVLADTVILGHNLLTNIIKVRASAMAYRPKEPVDCLFSGEQNIFLFRYRTGGGDRKRNVDCAIR